MKNKAENIRRKKLSWLDKREILEYAFEGITDEINEVLIVRLGPSYSSFHIISPVSKKLVGLIAEGELPFVVKQLEKRGWQNVTVVSTPRIMVPSGRKKDGKDIEVEAEVLLRFIYI